MGREGFDNENSIIEEINKNSFGHLNENLRDFLKFIFDKSIQRNDFLNCIKKAGQNKSDIIINFGKESHSISIKSGTGNSIHQESIEDFIDFLEERYNIKKKFANDLRFFIWGDGTLYGDGSISKRMSAYQIRKEYPDLITRLKIFFYENKKDLIKRFVVDGPKSSNSPEFIYYGNKRLGCWEESNLVLEWLINDNNESNGTIPVGRLTFQAWNRNINGGNKSESKRGIIQLKWGSIGKDLELIMRDKNE